MKETKQLKSIIIYKRLLISNTNGEDCIQLWMNKKKFGFK